MIKIRRLNLDTSWLLEFNDTSFLIDPWLVGSEVDGFSWFNEQWHIMEPVSPEMLPDYDYVLISQSYEDHCHLPTLIQLGLNKKFIASGKAFNKIKSNFNLEPDVLKEFPEQGQTFGNVNVLCVHPGRKIDPVYYAVIFEVDGDAIFYASHGFHLTEELGNELSKRYNFKLLITTFTHFKLPGFMGGSVNPGEENAMDLIKKLRPDYVVNTHDEKKKARGLISKIAKVKYPDFKEIHFPEYTEFVGIYDYDPVEIG